MGLIFAAVVLYTSAFYLAGLAVSSRARQSGTALVACIAVWAGCTIVAPTMVPYVVGEVVPLPPERELRAQSEEIEHQVDGAFHEEFDRLEEDFGRRMGLDGVMFGLGTMYSRVSLGSITVIEVMYTEAIPILTSFYGRFEPRRIAAGRDIAEVEDRLVHARARQVRIASSVNRWFVAPAFRSAVSALAGTDLRSFEVFVAHARRHHASLADWMREQGLFTSVLFFSPQPEHELYSRQETKRLAELGLLDPHFHVEGVVDMSQVPRFPDFRPSVATLLGGAGADLAVLMAANVLAFFLGLRWFVRRQIG